MLIRGVYSPRPTPIRGIQNAGHFAKSKTISVPFLYTKSHTLYVNVRSQYMAHDQFMAQICDCPIKCV